MTSGSVASVASVVSVASVASASSGASEGSVTSDISGVSVASVTFISSLGGSVASEGSWFSVVGADSVLSTGCVGSSAGGAASVISAAYTAGIMETIRASTRINEKTFFIFPNIPPFIEKAPTITGRGAKCYSVNKIIHRTHMCSTNLPARPYGYKQPDN